MISPIPQPAPRQTLATDDHYLAKVDVEHLDAAAEFQREHPNAGEAVVATAESFEAGIPELAGE
ncbi:MAG: hypothetical protein U0572_01245 [Phycisphaerales bacterium]